MGDKRRGEGGGRVGGHGEVEEGIAPCKELLGREGGREHTSNTAHTFNRRMARDWKFIVRLQ